MANIPAPPLLVTGNKIKAEEINALVAYFNEFWSGAEFSFDVYHPTDKLRQYGWGQTPITLVPEPTTGELILATQMNQLIAQVNVGLYHVSDDPNGLVSKLSVTPGVAPDPVDAAYFNLVLNKISNLDNDWNKLRVDFADLELEVLQTTSQLPWSEEISVAHQYHFTDYTHARQYFNAGGQLVLSFDIQPGGATADLVWQAFFESFDNIRIGAYGVSIVGEDGWNLIGNSVINKGFYEGIAFGSTPDNIIWTTIFDGAVYKKNPGSGGAYGAYGSAYAYAYAYSYAYAYGEYSTRRLIIDMAALENGDGTFDVLVKVTLREDLDDNNIISQPITMTSGYLTPVTIPDPNDGNISYFQEGNTTYQFIGIDPPTVVPYLDWTIS